MNIEELQEQVAALTAEVETWKGHSRKHEDRAKAAGDAAAKLAEAEQKLAEVEVATAEKLAEQTAESLGTLRAALIKAHGIDDNAVSLLTATDAETLQAQVASITALRGTPAPSPSAPLEGTSTPPAEDASRVFARELFAGE